jgi:hypothetical protein
MMREYLPQLLNYIPKIQPDLSQIKGNLFDSAEINEKSSISVSSSQIFVTPRLTAKTSNEVLNAAYTNFRLSYSLLKNYLQNPTKCLIINDVGIYLHLGGLNLLLKALGICETALFNAYLGKNLLHDYGSYISQREKIVLTLLRRYMTLNNFDLSLYSLDPFHISSKSHDPFVYGKKIMK